MTTYTLDEVAEILKVTKMTVRSEIEKNRLKAIKVGAIWRIPEVDLADYLGTIKNNFKTEKEVELEKEIEKIKKENLKLKNIIVEISTAALKINM
ncbi:helix-turn-helix domain-containing protein [Clostridium sp.]|uniref:helix-turn-helix domain-containing protein n=1 Tax=Clostridium sp. TaxID=1506 RepID=UPI003464554E